MKKIVLALLSASLFMSCSKDSDDANLQNQDGNSGKLKKVEEIQNGVVIKTADYVYNEAGNIAKLTVNDGTTIYESLYNYNTSNTMISWNLTESYVSDPSKKITQLNSLEYTNSKITNICIDRLDNRIPGYSSSSIDRISYAYNGLYPSSITHYVQYTYPTDSTKPLCSDILQSGNEELFEYTTDGNTSRYEAPNSGFSNVYYTIEYDTKKHYQSGIKPDAFKNTIGRSTKNNMAKLYEYRTSNNQLKSTKSNYCV